MCGVDHGAQAEPRRFRTAPFRRDRVERAHDEVDISAAQQRDTAAREDGVDVVLRFAGDRVSAGATRLLHPLSPTLAASATERILDFREGMRSISSLREFLTALALSLLMWTGIASVYFCSARAFPAVPELAAFSVSATMLLLATAMGGSLLQLPMLGWFTQIAVLAAALHGFFAVPLEPATACAAVMLFTTTLCVAPTGIILARIEGIALRDAARGSSALHT